MVLKVTHLFLCSGFVKLTSPSLIQEFVADPHDYDLMELRQLGSLNLAPSVKIRAPIKSQKNTADKSADGTRI